MVANNKKNQSSWETNKTVCEVQQGMNDWLKVG
jgi:hypothetical protein